MDQYNQIYISGFLIRRIYYEGEWWYCISDVVAYLTKSKDPIRYIVKLRKRYEIDLKIIRNENVKTFLLKTDKGNRISHCTNLYGLRHIARKIPKKYYWRVRIFRAWIE